MNLKEKLIETGGSIKNVSQKHFIALFVLGVYFSPFLFPDYSQHLIHDNLDSNVVWYSNLSKSGKLYSSNEDMVDISLGGIPRGCYPSEFFIPVQLFSFFRPYIAYTMNFFLIHIIAYIGFYLLSYNYISRGRHIDSLLFALAFSLVPFWPWAGLGIAGLPLLFFCLFRILDAKNSFWHFIPFFIIPFYSNFYFSGMYYFPIFSLIIIYFIYKNRKIPYSAILSLAVFYSISVLMEYRLILMEFVNHFKDHRQYFKMNKQVFGHLGVFRETFYSFFLSQYHMQGLQLFFAPVIIGLYLLRLSKPSKLVIALFILGLFYSFLYVLPSYGPFNALGLFGDINLRWIVVLPVLWYVLLALCLNNFSHSNEKIVLMTRRIFIVFVILNNLFFFFPAGSNSVYSNLENPFFYTYFDKSSMSHDSFYDFYHLSEFEEAKREVKMSDGKYAITISRLGNDSSYRFVPEILQYNGIRTLDAYFYYFPYEKKVLVSMIEQRELEKDEKMKIYFQEWGSRCYFISDELNRGKDTIRRLDYDFNLLRKSGCELVISPIPIRIPNLEKIFVSSNGRLNIYRLRLN